MFIRPEFSGKYVYDIGMWYVIVSALNHPHLLTFCHFFVVVDFANADMCTFIILTRFSTERESIHDDYVDDDNIDGFLLLFL